MEKERECNVMSCSNVAVRKGNMCSSCNSWSEQNAALLRENSRLRDELIKLEQTALSVNKKED